MLCLSSGFPTVKLNVRIRSHAVNIAPIDADSKSGCGGKKMLMKLCRANKELSMP